MNVTSIRTDHEHTEITYDKDRVRRDRILEVQRDMRKPQGIASISDGILPMMANLRHTGFFQGIDLDWNMCQVIDNHRPRANKRGGNFPDIEIRPAMHMDVRVAFRLECERGNINTYGLWDVDLMATIRSLFSDIMPPILQDAHDYGYRGKIVVTSSRRCDGFHSQEARENYIRSLLPDSMECLKSDPYCSNYFDRHRVYHRRDPMAQYILQRKPYYVGRPVKLARAELPKAKLAPANLWGAKLEVYNLLQQDPNLTQWQIANEVGCSQPNVSYHMRDLRSRGYIQ